MATSKQSRCTSANDDLAGEEQENQHTVKRPRRTLSLEKEDRIWRSLLLRELKQGDSKEIAEMNLQNSVTSARGFPSPKDNEEMKFLTYGPLRVRLQLPSESKWKVVSREDLRVDVGYVTAVLGSVNPGSNSDDGTTSESLEVVISGELDGSGTTLSSFVYLIRQGYISLRAVPCVECPSCCRRDHEPSGKLRVLLTKETLTDLEKFHSNQFLRKAMQTLIFWLRPDLVSEMGIGDSRFFFQSHKETRLSAGSQSRTGCGKQDMLDPSGLFHAIKPSRSVHGLDMIPELNPVLRPYQLRAAYWMVQRERGLGTVCGSPPVTSETDTSTSNCEYQTTPMTNSATVWYSDEHPLWFAFPPLDGSSEFFFNPYIGAVSSEPHDFLSNVKGGILADEMGLGKTVELLACISANPYKDLSAENPAEEARKLLHTKLARRKRERVDCTCGDLDKDEVYEGPWVQCAVCDAWQHATCVGHSRSPECTGSLRVSTREKRQRSTINPREDRRLKSLPLQGAVGDLGLSKKRGIRNQPTPDYREWDHDKKDELEGQKIVCGVCSALIGSVEVNGDCRATLIVVPKPILHQWRDEILRHVKAGSLRVIVYEGVGRGATIVMGGKGAAADDNKRLNIVSAHDLAAADIVLTTYDTLRADLSHDPDKSKSKQPSLRHAKRYPVIPTPLTRLRWWRLCLDEAQMVESKTRATEMALLLDAQNRWCVTGTPIQQGLDDLFGLLQFLRAEPFNDRRYWDQALRQPYEAGDARVVQYVHKFLGSLMWRSSKTDVKDELDLPPQEETVTFLHFSAVEKEFYRDQHEKIAVEARKVVAKYSQHLQEDFGTPDSHVSPAHSVDYQTQVPSLLVRGRDGVGTSNSRDPEHESIANAMMMSTTISNADQDMPLPLSDASVLSRFLLRLRQACCHPQVGSAPIRSLQQFPMTMEECLQTLIERKKTESEDEQRTLIAALNGLAALAATGRDFQLAISHYQEVLSLVEQNGADIDVDPLQKLHTLYNMAEVMGINSSLPFKGSGFEHRSEVKLGVTEDTEAVSGRLQRVIEGQDASHVMGKVSGNTNVSMEVPTIFSDDYLIEQCNTIRKKYTMSFETKVNIGLREFEHSNSQVSEAKMDHETFGGSNWWVEVLTMAAKRPDKGMDLVKKICNHLLEAGNLGTRGRRANASSLRNRIRVIDDLKLVIKGELDALESARDEVVEYLKTLNKMMEGPTIQDIERLVNCPRHSDMNWSLCRHCKMDDLFQVYENRLFLLRTSAAEANGVVSAEDAIIAQRRILAQKKICGLNISMELLAETSLMK